MAVLPSRRAGLDRPDQVLRFVCPTHRRQLTALWAAGLADRSRWGRPGRRRPLRPADDPGRKRRFCSDACKQAAYRARRREREQARQRAQDDARRQREEQARRAHDRARRRDDGLHAKAASTGFPEDADACRAKAEQLRSRYGL